MALLASFMAPGGCNAGTASLNSVSPTPKASNAAVGAAPVASNSPAPSFFFELNIPMMPAARTLRNCSGAP